MTPEPPAGRAGTSRLRRLARRLRPVGGIGAASGGTWEQYRDVSSPDLVRIPPVEVDPALAATPRLTVLLPHLQLERMTGGPNTVLNLVGRLAARGIPLRLASVIGPTDADVAPLRAHAEHLAGVDLPEARVEFQAAGTGDGPLRIGPRDVLMATWWRTAHVANVALDRIDADEFIYLIQDFEPGFYPWSTTYALARGTYEFPFRAVVNESLLLDYLAAQGGPAFEAGPATTRALAFEPAVDRSLFHVTRSPSRTLRLLFYARPKNRRNCFELGLRSLRDAVAAGAFDLSRWQFVAIGAPTPALDLGSGATLEPTAWRSYGDYAAMLRDSDLLLSLMLSPHTSYPPLEMAACGGAVVTNEFGPKTAARLAAIAPEIRAVAPSPTEVAAALGAAAREREAGHIGQGQVTAPASWERSFAEALPWLDRTVREVGRWT